MTLSVDTIDTWGEFRQRLGEYGRLSAARRGQLIFRGQADATWPLKTTLDREVAFASDQDRRGQMDELLRLFRREAMGLSLPLGEPLSDGEWEMLGRHHGLPTSILDWTESPYIAAYFAFTESLSGSRNKAAVWCLDREVFNRKDCPEIQIIDDEPSRRFNPRAVEQRGVSMRVASIAQTVEQFVDGSLFRFDIPASEANTVLADLDEMLINGRTLFRDLDGAAQSALVRARLLRGL